MLHRNACELIQPVQQIAERNGNNLIQLTFSLRNGVVEIAFVEGIAPQQPLDGKPGAFECPVFSDGFQCVLGAGGCEAAAGLLEGRDADLIESYQKYEGRDQDLPDHALNFLPRPAHFS